MIQFQSTGQSGNIFWILGAARKELQKQRRITEYNDMWERVQNSQSYEDALSIIREYVELVDTDGKY
jgi:hypothetical protein